jgi:DNA-binding SARP family transcriptional activator
MSSMAKGSLKASRALVEAGATEFRILGPLEARVGERVLSLGGAKQRAVLAILLLHANEVVSSDRLIDELWGADPPTTAATALQVHVSQLRKVLGSNRDLVVTHRPGYLIALDADQFDLRRFERLAAECERALAENDPASAAARARAALDLWRGPPLGDLAYEPFAQVPILRLEELRVGVIETRMEAELALGRHVEVVAELESLVLEHPLRERLRAQQILALYRSGRQADALAAYSAARRAFVDELGIEPSENLRRLELSILQHDPSLELVPAPERSILVLSSSEQDVDALAALAEPLALRRGRGLVLTQLITDPSGLPEANRQLLERRAQLVARGVSARAVAFVSDAPAADAVRLALRLDADLLLLGAPAATTEKGSFPEPLGSVLAEAPCDVGVLAERPGRPVAGPVIVPFGGSEHDWAAIEVGAWIARSQERSFTLAGVRSRRRRRDASRLLADASLAVQRALSVAADPVLVAAGADGLLEAGETAGLLVVGLSDRWRREGLGAVRTTVAQECPAPVLFVRRGVRPSGLAPRETATRYTWSLGPTSTT